MSPADIVEPGDFGGEPFVRDVPAFADIAEDAADHARMVHRPDLAEVGQAAGRPQPPGRRRRAWRRPPDPRRCSLSTARSIASGAGAQQRIVAARLEAGDQRADVGEVEVGIAPVEMVERAGSDGPRSRAISSSLKAGAGFAAKAERAEAAVALVAPGAAGDLRHFGDRQAAVAAAVEFLEAGEGDMGDVHVEAHADGVGGDQIIDLAALEHRHLGVAGRRATERP